MDVSDNLAFASAGERAEPSGRFNPDMLTTAREAAFLSQSELAEKIGVKQPLVAKWEAGLARPDPSQVTALSIALAVLSVVFFIDRPRKLASMSDYYHRALARAPRRDVKAVHARCNLIDIQVDRLLRIAEPMPDCIPDIDPKEHGQSPEQIAAITREKMGIKPGPIPNLVAAIERCGGIVIDRDFEVDEVDALCRWVPEMPKLFFLNSCKSPDRTRFSLAHELGHTIMHFCRDVEQKIAEDQANSFAQAFLLPSHEIRRDFCGNVTLADLAAIKRKWRVSMQLALHCGHKIGAIDDRRYKWLNIQIAKNGWKKSEPIQIDGETPTALTRLLQQHIEAGFSPSDLAELLFVSEEAMDRMLKNASSPTYEENGVRLRIVTD